MRDLYLTVRGLWRKPLFTVVTTVTLTLGLGAFAVVYTAVDKVLLEPLPYERSDDLYYVWRDWGQRMPRGWLDDTDVTALQDAGGVIEAAVGLWPGTRTLSDDLGGEPEELAVVTSSPGLFELLGGAPFVLGRGFAPDEVGPGRAPVTVLSYDLWRRRFDGDTSIVGSQVRLNGEPFLVVGVTDPSFRFARHRPSGEAERVDAYITFEVVPDSATAGLIRARPGTPPDQVAAAVDVVGARLDDDPAEVLTLTAVGVKPGLVARVRPALVVLGFAGVFLVLVLMLNLATVLLARTAERERELAVSRALGANGLALTRRILLEGGLLGALGGTGGALSAVWGTSALVALAPLDLPRRDAVAVDGEIAAVVLGVGVLLGLLAAALPAAWATRTGLSPLLSYAAVRGGGGHGALRRGLVVVQVALSLVLLSAGGLVAQSFERLLRTYPGFESAGVLTLRVPVPTLHYPDAAATASLHRRIESALAALPGVAAVSATTALPLSGDTWYTAAWFPGAPGNTGAVEHDYPPVDEFTTRPGYFDVMGIPILSGRTFDAASANGRREVLIDQTLATTFFPGRTPIGATMRALLGGSAADMTIVGVVERTRLYDVHDQDGRAQIFIRADNADGAVRGTLSWVLCTDRPPLSLGPEVRAAVLGIDPQLAVTDTRSMDQIVADSLRQQRLSAVLLTGFALSAVLLAAMALYGVVSGSVTRRRHEIAVRLALGADHHRLVRWVVQEGAVLILFGLLIGVPGSYFVAGLLRGVLVGISPFEPITLGVIACGLTLVALAACYLPARRVIRIDPARSLQAE